MVCHGVLPWWHLEEQLHVLLSSWWPLRGAACFAGKTADCVSPHAEPFLPFPFQEEISSRICLLSSWRRLKIKAERDQRVGGGNHFENHISGGNLILHFFLALSSEDISSDSRL